MPAEGRLRFTRRTWLYVGGLMGPFGAGVLTPMIPEIRQVYGISNAAAAWGFTAYLIPFAGLLLVSGTLASRWGVARTLQLAFAAYAPATVLCALAPTFELFLAGRVLQGLLNAFMTPLLLAALSETVAPTRLGRVVGTYAAFQALGQLLAPLAGGVAADYDWRLAFVAVAVVSTAVAFGVPPERRGTSALEPVELERREVRVGPALRQLLHRPTLLLGITALIAAAGPLGASVLVALSARDQLGLEGSAAGLVLMAGAAAAMVSVQAFGRLLDALGGRAATIAALVATGALVAATAGAHSVLKLTMLWAATGAVSQFVVVGFQALATSANPSNRAGVLSFTLAHRFTGHGVGAIIWLPVFDANSNVAYLGSAAITVLAVAAVLGSGLGRVGERAAR